MGTFTIKDVRSRAQEATAFAKKTAAVALAEDVRAQDARTGEYDVFLSHAFKDAELIVGIKRKLEKEFGYSVYVDWIDDSQLDRSKVTSATAELLRARMKRCRCLFYAVTPNCVLSKWMPWECGYFDGKKNRVAILPLTERATVNYAGQEYLGVYPYITESPATGETKNQLWVRRSSNEYCTFTYWLGGGEPTKR